MFSVKICRGTREDSPKEETRPEPVVFERSEGRLGEGVTDEPEPSASYGDEQEGAVGILSNRQCKVTHQVVLQILLTTKQKLRFSIRSSC